MNIVFVADSGYLPYLAVAIRSLLQSNPNPIFNIYIVNSNLNTRHWNALLTIDRERRHGFINARVSDRGLEHVALSKWLTRATYYKLLIPDVVPHDKAVYFDCDLLIRGTIEDLWNVDIAESFLAAVEDGPIFTRSEELEMSSVSKYFNAGVMVLNLDMWRKESLKNRVLEFVERKPQAIKWGDQCGLNAIVDGRWKSLHPRFNMQRYFYRIARSNAKTDINRQEILEAIAEPTVVHFTELPKSLELACTHPYKREFWEHLANTQFSRKFPRNISAMAFIRRCFPFFPGWLGVSR